MWDVHRKAVKSHDDHDNFDGKPHSPWHPPTPLNISKSSLTQKVSTQQKSDVQRNRNKQSDKSKILRDYPTKPPTNMPTAAADDPPVDDDTNAIVDNVDDNDHYPTEIECTDAIDSTFLQEWNDFVMAFEKSPTYARAHTSVARTTTSHIVNDDDGNDTHMTSEHNASTPLPPDSYADSLCRLNQVLWELEQVNNQLFQLINAGAFTAPNVPPLLPYNNPQQPKPCPEPQHDCAPQSVILRAPPPAPDPAGTPCSNRHPRSLGNYHAPPFLNQPAFLAVPQGTHHPQEQQFQTGPNQRSRLLQRRLMLEILTGPRLDRT